MIHEHKVSTQTFRTSTNLRFAWPGSWEKVIKQFLIYRIYPTQMIHNITLITQHIQTSRIDGY